MSDIFRDFDKKNEVPKVKISKFATGGICNDAIFPKLDVFMRIDEIVKDIAKQKDNAMAMEFTKCIGELLRKNGVVPKMTEYTANRETDNTFETRYGVSIDELDFSEHDKEFEDKIASLENQIAYMKEKKNYLRTRCMEDAIDAFDSGAYGRLTIVGRRVDLDAENEKLKERIAELESENEKLFDYLNGITGNTKAEIKNNIKNIEKIDKKPTKRTGVIVAKEINGQNHVTLDDFMRVVNDLQ